MRDQEPRLDQVGVQQPHDVAPGWFRVGEAAEDGQVVADSVVDAQRDGIAVRWQAADKSG